MTDETKDCAGFLERLNRVLDGDAAQTSLIADEHVMACAVCRGRLAAARVLTACPPVLPVPSPGFAIKAVNAALLAERQRSRTRIAFGVGFAALAASLALAFWLSGTPKPVTPDARPVMASHGVQKPLAEAREAIASLGTKAMDESIAPAANLFAVAPEKPQPAASMVFSELPDAAKAGVQPLVNSPKRAINLFLRDVGGVATTSRKPNS